MQNIITSEQLAAVKALLPGKKNIVIFTHIAPDGDAMGSSLGLANWLRSDACVYSKDIQSVTIIVPTKFPPFLAWMPGASEILVFEGQQDAAKAAVDAADLIFCLDFNEPKRIGYAASLLSGAACPKILLDHHLNPDPEMVDVVISYPQTPAASYLVLELIDLLLAGNTASAECLASAYEQVLNAVALPEDVATCLYTGLMTDTGNFAYNSNYPMLYRMIAQLIMSGINKDKIYDAVFNQYSVDRLRFVGFCVYHKMRIFPKYHTALIALTSDELRRFNFQSGDAEGIVNMPLQIANVYYSCFMREDVEKIKVSFRSQGDRPVNEFAHEFFNGGGHMNAAGGEFYGTVAEAVKCFEDNYQKHFLRD